MRNDRVIATSPNVIAVLDAKSDRALTSLGDVFPGSEVVVIGMRALDPIWHSPKGQGLLDRDTLDLISVQCRQQLVLAEVGPDNLIFFGSFCHRTLPHKFARR